MSSTTDEAGAVSANRTRLITLGDERPGARGRVLCVASNFPRWEGDSTTTFVLHLAQDLQELGWTVDVLAPHDESAALSEDLEGIHVERHRYAWPARAETVCYRGGALVNLRRNPSEAAKVPSLVSSQLAAITRRLATGRYDLLHTHWALPQGFTGAVAAKSLRVRHVLTLHGEEFTVLKSNAVRPFKRFALHKADAVTANSTVTAAQALATAPRMKRLDRIPMGVCTDMVADPEMVVKIRGQYRRADGPLLLHVGRLVEEKGVEDLLKATANLAPHLRDTTCVIGGAGQDEPRLRRLASELGLNDRVTFVGFIAARELPSWFAAADMFVAPSKTGPDGWQEGQGLTPLEAMVLGTPVIATRSGGYVDTIVDGETALAVGECDPVGIANAVRTLHADPVLAARLSANGRKLAVDRYSRRASAASFSALFDELVRANARR